MESTTTTSSAGFNITYDGAAVQQGEMDVQVLAPALLSLGQLFEQANQVANAEGSTVSLRIRATDRGSFSIEMDLVQLAFVGTTIMGGSFVATAAHLKELIVGDKGLLDLIRRFRGERPQVEQANDGSLRLKVRDFELTVPPARISLLDNRAVRQSALRVVNPLIQEGIDSLSVRDDDGEILRLNKGDCEYFAENPGLEELVTDTEFQLAFKVTRLSFNERSRWRLTADGFEISAEIRDSAFWALVHDNSARFSEGDILVCRVRARQRQVEGGDIQAEYEVLEVVRHVRAGSQFRLLDDDDDQAD